MIFAACVDVWYDYDVLEKSLNVITCSSVPQAEKKADLIKTGCQLACKRLHGTYQGSGSTLEKHQVRNGG